jgi:hypothetical protein
MQTVNQVLMILQSAVGRVDVFVIRNVISHVDLSAMSERLPKAIQDSTSTPYLWAVEDRTKPYYVDTWLRSALVSFRSE